MTDSCIHFAETKCTLQGVTWYQLQLLEEPMKQGRLILTVGIPGSGKSYWADQQVTADPIGTIKIERDEIRMRLTGDRRDHSHEMEVTDIAHVLCLEALRDGMTVIVADTNLIVKYRKGWRDYARMTNSTYEEASFLDVPLDVCLERNAARPDPVPEHVIRRMAQTIQVAGYRDV